MSVDLFDLQDLEARISADTVKQILDDDNDGTADDNAVTRLIEDGSSYVIERIADVWPIEDPPQRPLVRLGLDAATAYAAMRHPEYVRRDWKALFEWIDKQIDRFREERATLVESLPTDPDDGYDIITDPRRGW